MSSVLLPDVGHWSADFAGSYSLLLRRIDQNKRSDAAQRVDPHPGGKMYTALVSSVQLVHSQRWPRYSVSMKVRSIVEQVSVASCWVNPEHAGHFKYLAPGSFHVAVRSQEDTHRLVGVGPVIVAK